VLKLPFLMTAGTATADRGTLFIVILKICLAISCLFDGYGLLNLWNIFFFMYICFLLIFMLIPSFVNNYPSWPGLKWPPILFMFYLFCQLFSYNFYRMFHLLMPNRNIFYLVCKTLLPHSFYFCAYNFLIRSCNLSDFAFSHCPFSFTSFL
jgi:hypothetical protein